MQCPVLLMCSNRSMPAGKTWRDEYGEGRRSLLFSSHTLRIDTHVERVIGLFARRSLQYIIIEMKILKSDKQQLF